MNYELTRAPFPSNWKLPCTRFPIVAVILQVFNVAVPVRRVDTEVPSLPTSCMAKLCAIGLLKLTKEEKYNPSFAITDDGVAVLKQQTYANLAQTALFNLNTQQLNDKTLELSKRAVRQNWLMLVVAIASVVVAIVGVIVALRD